MGNKNTDEFKSFFRRKPGRKVAVEIQLPRRKKIVTYFDVPTLDSSPEEIKKFNQKIIE